LAGHGDADEVVGVQEVVVAVVAGFQFDPSDRAGERRLAVAPTSVYS
jgi:hypothetical protein